MRVEWADKGAGKLEQIVGTTRGVRARALVAFPFLFSAASSGCSVILFYYTHFREVVGITEVRAL